MPAPYSNYRELNEDEDITIYRKIPSSMITIGAASCNRIGCDARLKVTSVMQLITQNILVYNQRSLHSYAQHNRDYDP